MDRAEALRLLPETYARALVLQEQGIDNAGIAMALGIVPEAISSLLWLGQAKLGRLLEEPREERRPIGRASYS